MEKMAAALMTVGQDELQAMIDEDHGAELSCQFCNSKYHFDESELQEILNKLKNQELN